MNNKNASPTWRGVEGLRLRRGLDFFRFHNMPVERLWKRALRVLLKLFKRVKEPGFKRWHHALAERQTILVLIFLVVAWIIAFRHICNIAAAILSFCHIVLLKSQLQRAIQALGSVICILAALVNLAAIDVTDRAIFAEPADDPTADGLLNDIRVDIAGVDCARSCIHCWFPFFYLTRFCMSH